MTIQYQPGAAFGANIHKDGETWTLVLVRTLSHPPAKVWHALTDPAQIREWAPYDPDRNLGTTGPVTLSTVGTPTPHVVQTSVQRAEAPRLLEFSWGGNDMRWELEPVYAGTEGATDDAPGTRLTLWHSIGRQYIAMGAAGWHICFDVLDAILAGHPIGRIAGGDAMTFDGWHRLHAAYATQFGNNDESTRRTQSASSRST